MSNCLVGNCLVSNSYGIIVMLYKLEQVPRGSRIPPAGTISKSVTLTLGQQHQQNDVSYSVIV